jgi:hypothetical protein
MAINSTGGSAGDLPRNGLGKLIINEIYQKWLPELKK